MESVRRGFEERSLRKVWVYRIGNNTDKNVVSINGRETRHLLEHRNTMEGAINCSPTMVFQFSLYTFPNRE